MKDSGLIDKGVDMTENPLHVLHELGQSVWYDNIRRALLTSGDLARYTDEYAVTGVTSNPTIFERAIAGSDDYDEVLRGAVERGVDDAEALFWELAVADIRDAADVLRGVYDRTDGGDGYVSLELPPRLSRDAGGSVTLGTDLARRVDRPNMMIKVPGTSEGVAAIEALTHRGVNVNVTLLFSLEQWRAVAEAYLRGLERRHADGAPLDVASVASFFISRIDAKANDRLPEELHNRVAVASAQVAYAAYRELLDTERWRRLAAAGARPQRLLWASTSTKDPRLPDTHYVTALAAPDSVNTMPEQTMFAFAAHGVVGAALSTDDAEEARATLDDAAVAGVDAEALGRELQDEGDEKFADSFDRLLECITAKRAALGAGPRETHHLGPIADAVDAVRDEVAGHDAVERLWTRDHTLWQEDPTGVADRLGWLTAPARMEEEVEQLRVFAEKAAADGLTHVLLVGMGGSSLFPLVAARTFGTAAGALELHVLDSVDPQALRRVEARLPLEETLVVASSKSGTTAETRSLLEWFWERAGNPSRFAVITDPGSPLAELGRERGFRAVFEAQPDIGGRYSALSHFGLVPAALAGVDVAELLHRAGRTAAASSSCVPTESNPGVQLASVLAAGVREGRDKLTLVADEGVASFGLWIEQLIAESTGKDGTGIVPIVGEPLGPPEVYGDDRLFVAIGGEPDELAALADAGHPVVVLDLAEPVDLGSQVLRWEIATALAGAVLGLNPFDQPDVEAAKDATRHALKEGVSEPPVEPLEGLLAQVKPGDHLALQAYVDPEDPVVADLERVRVALRDRYRVATSLGIGPRYLHSTGQLHKGGPDQLVVVQAIGDDADDPPIPGERFGFATLKRAQAAGDLATLKQRGRRAGRVRLDELLGGA